MKFYGLNKAEDLLLKAGVQRFALHVFIFHAARSV